MATRTPVCLENSKTDMGDGGVSTYLSRSSALSFKLLCSSLTPQAF